MRLKCLLYNGSRVIQVTYFKLFTYLMLLPDIQIPLSPVAMYLPDSRSIFTAVRNVFAAFSMFTAIYRQ
jgi:hypothetical protein